MTYHREQDIGKPKVDPVSVTVLNTETVEAVTHKLEEVEEELKKVRIGQEFILGQEIEEE